MINIIILSNSTFRKLIFIKYIFLYFNIWIKCIIGKILDEKNKELKWKKRITIVNIFIDEKRNKNCKNGISFLLDK